MKKLGSIYAKSEDTSLIEKSRQITNWLVEHDSKDENLPENLWLDYHGGSYKINIII